MGSSKPFDDEASALAKQQHPVTRHSVFQSVAAFRRSIFGAPSSDVTTPLLPLSRVSEASTENFGTTSEASSDWHCSMGASSSGRPSMSTDVDDDSWGRRG